MNQLNTFIKQRPQRYGLWMALFMMFLLFAGTTDALATLPDGYTFSVDKQDVYCETDGGAVRVTVTSTTQSTRPNGSYRLLTSDGAIVSNAQDKSIDASATQPWTVTWYNIPAGSYKVLFIADGASTGDQIGDVLTIASKVPADYNFSVTSEVSPVLSTSTTNSLNTGSIKYTPTGFVGPLTYTFTINDGTPTTITDQSGTYTLTGLSANDKVEAVITDNGYSCTTDLKNKVTITSTVPQETAKICYYNTIFRTQNGTDCSFNNYICFNLRVSYSNTSNTATGLSRERLIDFLTTSGNAQIRKNSGDWYDLQAQTDVQEIPDDNGLHSTLTLKVPDELGDFVENDTWEVRYKGSGANDDYTTFGGTITKFGYENDDKSLGTLVLTNTTYRDASCNLQWGMKYSLTNGIKENSPGTTGSNLIASYFFPQSSTILTKVEKKKDDGTYEDVTSTVKANSSNTLSLQSSVVTPYGEIQNASYSINLNADGLQGGTYRLTYTNNCSTLAASKEITITDPADDMAMTLSTNTNYGFNGNTSGIVATFSGTNPTTINFKLERKSDTDDTYPEKDYTFKGTPFLNGTEQYYTIHFPVEKEDIAFDGRTYLMLPDLPKGTYRLTVTDQCSNKSLTGDVIISSVRTWNPKNTDGYSNGIKVKGDCQGGYDISMDFGENVNSNIEAFCKTKGVDPWYGIASSYYSHNIHYKWGDGWHVSGGKDYTEVTFEYRIGAKTVVYDAITNTLEKGVKNEMFTTDESYRINYMKIPLGGSSNAGFKVTSATCDNTTSSLGLISAEVTEGYTPTYPICFKLYDATATTTDGVTTVTKGELHDYGTSTDDVNTYTIDDSSKGDSHIFANLPQGWYTVEAYNNYKEDGTGCDPQIFNINVSPAGLPNINVDGTEATGTVSKGYVEGNALTSKLDLPVSDEMYDVTWWDVTDPDNPQQLNSGTVSPTMSFTPTAAKRYVIEARTTFHTGVCEGSSGGTRRVVIDYTGSSTTTANYWIGGTEGKETDFETASNWTANKVITNGDDLIFATVDNYGTAAKANCELPVGKVIRVNNLTNESDKALVVTPKSYVSVVGAITGYDEATDEDKLVIKADANGSNATGTFLVLNNDAANTTVYATVELAGWGHRLADTPSFEDNIEGSPTYGKTLYGAPFAWQQIGIPVESADAKTYFTNTVFQTYNEATNSSNSFYHKWTKVDLTKPLESFKVYQIAYDEVSDGTTPHIYTIKGKLVTTDRMLTLTRQAAEVTSSTSTDEKVKHYGLGQNIFANSYTGSISIANIKFPAEVENTVYLYRTGSVADWHIHHNDEDKTQSVAGGWMSIPKNITNTDLPTTIPAMQGFLLKFNDDDTKVGSDVVVTLSYAQNGSEFIKPNDRPQRAPSKNKGVASSETQDGYLKILLNSEKTSDVLYEIQTPDATDGFDNGWDGRKLFYGEGSLYAETTDGKMQINAVPSVVGQTFSVNSGTKEESYELAVVRSGLSNGLMLKDLVTNQEIALDNDTTVYLFTANETNGANRFRIVGNTTGITSIEDGLQVVVSDGTISISGANGPASIDIYGANGVRMLSHDVTSGSEVYRPKLPQGVYVVVINVQGQKVTRKMAIN